MSHQAVTYVKTNSKMRRGAYTVLLMLAEMTPNDGFGWWTVSYPKLAEAARLHPRQVKRLILQIAEAGEIDVEWSDGGQRNRYHVAMSPEEVAGNSAKMSLLKPGLIEQRKRKQPKHNSANMSLLCVNGSSPEEPSNSDITTLPNSDNMPLSTDTRTVTFATPNSDICDNPTVTFAPCNSDICADAVGGKGGDSLPESFPTGLGTGPESPVNAPVIGTPQPPDGGSAGVEGITPRSKVPPPKHRPDDARAFIRAYPIREDLAAFTRSWDKAKPDDEAIAKSLAIFEPFAGRTLTDDEKTKVCSPAVFVNQARWDWDVPFKGLAILEISRRPRERPRTIEDERAAQAETERARREAEAAAAHTAARRSDDEITRRLDAEIADLPEFERDTLHTEATSLFHARFGAGKDPANPTNARLVASFARDIYRKRREAA